MSTQLTCKAKKKGLQGAMMWPHPSPSGCASDLTFYHSPITHSAPNTLTFFPLSEFPTYVWPQDPCTCCSLRMDHSFPHIYTELNPIYPNFYISHLLSEAFPDHCVKNCNIPCPTPQYSTFPFYFLLRTYYQLTQESANYRLQGKSSPPPDSISNILLAQSCTHACT